MICNLKFKKDVFILTMLLWILSLVLKLCPIQVVILLPLWIKPTMGQLLLFFICNFSSIISYVGGIPVTNYFSLISRYILAIQQIMTHKEHLWYSFWFIAIFWSASEALALWSQQQKLIKTTWKSLSLSNSSQKSPFFSVLMYALYGHPSYSKFKQKHQ